MMKSGDDSHSIYLDLLIHRLKCAIIQNDDLFWMLSDLYVITKDMVCIDEECYYDHLNNGCEIDRMIPGRLNAIKIELTMMLSEWDAIEAWTMFLKTEIEYKIEIMDITITDMEVVLSEINRINQQFFGIVEALSIFYETAIMIYEDM